MSFMICGKCFRHYCSQHGDPKMDGCTECLESARGNVSLHTVPGPLQQIQSYSMKGTHWLRTILNANSHALPITSHSTILAFLGA